MILHSNRGNLVKYFIDCQHCRMEGNSLSYSCRPTGLHGTMRLSIIVCLDLYQCLLGSVSVVLSCYGFIMFKFSSRSSAQARPKQALHDTSIMIPSEARSLLGLECLRMASGRISRVRLNFLSCSLQRLRPRPRVLLRQRLWAPSRWSCKAYKLYVSAGLCLPGKSMFARLKNDRTFLAQSCLSCR